MNKFGDNLKFLRELKNLTQAQIAVAIGLKRSQWANYETGVSFPKFLDLLEIAKFFGIHETDLIHRDLTKGNLIIKLDEPKKQEKGNLIGNPIGNLKPSKRMELPAPCAEDPPADYGKTIRIPITDMSDIAAASGAAGIYNNDQLEAFHFPSNMCHKGATYIAVKITDHSMSPTLLINSHIILRLLRVSEYENMPENHIYIISDTNGEVYLKRVKRMFNEALIALSSDSRDKRTFHSFTMPVDRIQSVWHVEYYLVSEIPDTQDIYNDRLQKLEDKLGELLNASRKK